MTDRDYAQDFTHLLHILVDKVRWFTEESVRQAHAIITAQESTTVLEPTDVEPAPAPVKKAPAKKRPAKDA